MTIFVSYARVDYKDIQPVLAEIRNHGFELWIDEEGIEGASFWRREIVEAIERSSAILFFATEASCKSDAVSKELSLANEENKPILPVLLKTIKLPSDLRYQIAGIQNIDLSLDRSKGINNIIAALSHITNRRIDTLSNKIEPKKSSYSNKNIKFLNMILLTLTVLFIPSYYYLTYIDKDSHQSQSEAINKQEDNTISKTTRAIGDNAYGNQNHSTIPNEPIILRALVIGNNSYKNPHALLNSVNDAKDVTDSLKSLGFQVTELIDLGKNKLLDKVSSYYESFYSPRTRNLIVIPIINKSINIIFYSGHSIEIGGQQYIVPIDADMETPQVEQFISISEITPEGHGISVDNNFALYSTKKGGLALDGDRTNSPFTKALIDGLRKPELDVFSLFSHICQSVKLDTHQHQIPWMAASADSPLWLGNIRKSNIKGNTSIIIIDGCRNNPFESKTR